MLCRDMKIRLHVVSTLVLWLWCATSNPMLVAEAAQFSHSILKESDEFDYIVVGAGAGGSAVAARLALAGNNVLLLEAGGDAGLLSKIPRTAVALQGSRVDWFYETISNNKSCLSFHNRQCRFSRGRCLGGSTSINYMLYIRGNRRDYDLDVPGWSWNELQPYFLRSEGLQSRELVPMSSYPYHNTSGPVEISFFYNSKNPWKQRILDGFLSLNFPYNPDVNAGSQIGVSRVLGYVYKGERVTTATAYLKVKDVNRNLKIVTDVRCTGIIFENDIARGVSVVQGKFQRITKVYAKHEVILSAGTIGNTQLLLLSGIGPADHLKSLQITVRANLPVGENMSDHVLPLILIKVDRKAITLLELLGMMALDSIEWLLTHNGSMGSIGVTDIVGFANTDCYNFTTRRLEHYGPECNLPNVQIIFSYIDLYSMNIVPKLVRQIFGAEVVDQILEANKYSAFLIASPILLQPRSRGWIRLRSADPMVAPAITPNYLDDERDVKEIAKFIEIVKHMVETPPFREQNATILQLKMQGCPDFNEDGYWECYTRHMTNSVYHAVGTVALGTVVDERLRVREVKRLRVGDLSVLPKIPRGNTAAAAIAIGERLADFLLQDKDSWE